MILMAYGRKMALLVLHGWLEEATDYTYELIMCADE